MIFIPVQSTVREHRQLKILANSNLFPLFLAKKEIAFEVASFRSKFYCYFQWGHIFWNFVVNLLESLNSLTQIPTKVNYFSSPVRV